MKKTLLLILVFGLRLLNAQDRPQYAVSAIPDSLKKDVNAVLREHTTTLTIKSPGRARQEEKEVITVLNEKGKGHLLFVQYPDKFNKVEDIEINVYDEKGNYIRHYKRKDLEKAYDNDGMSLITDNKMIYGIISAEKYPITVEYNYTNVFEGVLEFKDFYPQLPEQTIQKSSYTIVTTPNNKIRYKNYRCGLQPSVKEENGTITYNWSVQNSGAIKLEDGIASRDIPKVMIAPTLFEMDDYDGDMSSWQSFGKWQINLINQTNKLPEQSQGFYRNLVKDAKTEREKVAILYKYLQDNFRYVSIQLGIGGWKPFSAEFVESKKYGDCKALSNFMQAMLNAVNIRSHYAIINAGYDEMPVDKDFPQNVFNHVILCVPQPKDTIWLECTSRTQPFAVLGNFTENRNAFLITENGGVMVPTPRSKASSNVLHSNTLINLTENGSGTAAIDIHHSGEFTDELNNRLFESTDQVKKSYLINRVGFKQPDDLQINKKDVNGSQYTLHYDMSYEKIPDFSTGSKMFLNARLYKFWNTILPKAEKRDSDYYLEFPLIKADTTVYQLPEGFIVETMPKPAIIKDAIGQFESDYKYDAGKRQIQTTCRIIIDQHVIKAAHYLEAAKFFSDIVKEQQQKLVIKKE